MQYNLIAQYQEIPQYCDIAKYHDIIYFPREILHNVIVNPHFKSEANPSIDSRDIEETKIMIYAILRDIAIYRAIAIARQYVLGKTISYLHTNFQVIRCRNG